MHWNDHPWVEVRQMPEDLVVKCRKWVEADRVAADQAADGADRVVADPEVLFPVTVAIAAETIVAVCLKGFRLNRNLC